MALVAIGRRTFRLEPAGLVPVGDERWKRESRSAPIDRDDPKGPRLELTFTRGAEKVTVGRLFGLIFETPGFVIARDASGLVRIDLPSGARRTLVPAADYRWSWIPFAPPWRSFEEARINVKTVAGQFLLDPAAGTLTQVADTPGFVPCVFRGTRVIGGSTDPTARLLVRDGPDAPPRPVIPD